MTSRRPITITLGAQSFEIRPLTIDQMEALESAVQLATPRLGVSMGKRVLEVALTAADHPGVDVGKLVCGVGEILAATHEILRFAGFDVKPSSPGGAGAAALKSAPGSGEMSEVA